MLLQLDQVADSDLRQRMPINAAWAGVAYSKW
jgi:hypothetical protein